MDSAFLNLEKIEDVSCYDFNRDVLTQIYDLNGNALTMGYIVDLINLLIVENKAQQKKLDSK